MISFVRGTVSDIEENCVEIDTGALGYEIMMPLSDIERLSGLRQEVKIFTYLNVREDEMSLFGFLTKDALELFKKLITVAGIGPRGALGILGVFTPADLRFAILSGDVKAITKAPGIGTKTAQRLVIELKDKVDIADGLREIADSIDYRGEVTDDSARSEAVMALTVLGYSNQEALKALQGIETEGRDTEDILKDALKKMGR